MKSLILLFCIGLLAAACTQQLETQDTAAIEIPNSPATPPQQELEQEPEVVAEPEELPVEETSEIESETPEQPNEEPTSDDMMDEEEMVDQPLEVMAGWRTAQFEDVLTGETFSVDSFAGKPVLLESFAVWCPKCTAQQRHMQALHEEVGDDVITIALNTDPNEDAEAVKTHAERNGFTESKYAVADADTTKELIDEFGVRIVSAPSVPVILICPSGDATLLGTGSKPPQSLLDSIEEMC